MKNVTAVHQTKVGDNFPIALGFDFGNNFTMCDGGWSALEGRTLVMKYLGDDTTYMLNLDTDIESGLIKEEDHVIPVAFANGTLGFVHLQDDALRLMIHDNVNDSIDIPVTVKVNGNLESYYHGAQSLLMKFSDEDTYVFVGLDKTATKHLIGNVGPEMVELAKSDYDDFNNKYVGKCLVLE